MLRMDFPKNRNREIFWCNRETNTVNREATGRFREVRNQYAAWLHPDTFRKLKAIYDEVSFRVEALLTADLLSGINTDKVDQVRCAVLVRPGPFSFAPR